MIRVNLLPRKRESRREESRLWLVLVAMLLIAEMVGIVIVHANKKEELSRIVGEHRQIEVSIAEKRGKSASHETVKKQLAEFTARENAIEGLQKGRTGPTNLLLELSRVLTPNKLPSADPEVLEKLQRENPTAVPSKSWDSRKLWLVSFREVGQQVVKPGQTPDRAVVINGLGRGGADIDEFLRRLSVSRFFTDVRLLRRDEKVDRDARTGVVSSLVSFDMRVKARY